MYYCYLDTPIGDLLLAGDNDALCLGGFPEVALMEDLLLMRKLRRQSRPVLLPGPLRVSPRRWQRSGVVRQTARNWSLLAAERLGVSPNSLARFYPPHRDSS